MKKLLCLFIALCGLSATAESGEYRNFTNLSGKTVYARIVQYDVEGERVQLELKNHKKAWVQLVDLSQADQAYIQQYNLDKSNLTSASHAATPKLKIDTDLNYKRKSQYSRDVWLYPAVRLKTLTMPRRDDLIDRPSITLTVLFETNRVGDLRTIKFRYDWIHERWTKQPTDYSPVAESKEAPKCNLYKLVSSTIENAPKNPSMSFRRKPQMLACATRVWIDGEQVTEKIDTSRTRPLPEGWEEMIAE